jgi:hypothetical protein
MPRRWIARHLPFGSALFALLVLAAPAWGTPGTWERAWGMDVISGNPETGAEVCTVAAQCKLGTTGGLGGEFNDLGDVAVSQTGRVYVTDIYNMRVVEFDPGGSFVRTWGQDVVAGNAETGPEICTVAAQCKAGTLGVRGGALYSPISIGVDAAGNVYVAEQDARVSKFDADGNFLRAWGKDVIQGNGFDGAEICTVASQCQQGIAGTRGGELLTAAFLGVSPAGDVYATEASHFRLSQFDSSGNFVRMWGKDVVEGNGVTTAETCTVASQCKIGVQSFGAGEFYAPWGAATDAAGNLYVSEGFSTYSRVQKFSPTGDFLLTFGKDVSSAGGTGFEVCTVAANCTTGGERGSTAGAFWFVQDVAVDGAGNVYTGESINQRIQKFTSSGAFVTSWGKGVDGGVGFETCATVDGCAGGFPGNLGGELNNGAGPGLGADPLAGQALYVTEFTARRVQKYAGVDAPAVAAVTPGSPANQNSINVTGTAPAGTTVTLYASSTCTGSPITSGTAVVFASPGLAVTVADDSTTTFYAIATGPGGTSACSTSSVTYVEDSTAPATPVITGTSPMSPNADTTPKVLGTAEAGSTVRLYTTSDCSGPAAGSVAAAVFSSPGVTGSLGGGDSATFRVTATDAAGNVSGCSAGVTYRLPNPIDTRITSGPDGPTSDTTPTFAFVADPAAGAALECSLDRAAFTACSSPLTYSVLPDGLHSFRVRALAPGGAPDDSPASSDFFVDTVAPVSTGAPAAQAGFGAQLGPSRFSGRVMLGRSAVDPAPGSGVAEIRCVLDPPSPPASIDAIVGGCPLVADAPGSHTLWVASRDNAGNAEPPHLVATFEIAGPPDTTITFGPTGDTWNSTPVFAFTSTVPGSTFVCRMDNLPVACASPYTPASPLAPNGHVFSVAAVSPDGVVDPTPATRTFRVAPRETVTGTCEKRPVGRFDRSQNVIAPYPNGTPFSTSKTKFSAKEGYDPATGCTLEPGPCPLRAKCTIRVTMRFDEADITFPPPGFKPSYGYIIEWNPGLLLLSSYVGDASLVSPEGLRRNNYCQIRTNARSASCTAETTATVIGAGRPIVAACWARHHGVVPPGLDGAAEAWGPDDQRFIGCNISVTIEPTATLETVTYGETVAVFVTEDGTIDLTPGSSGRATAAASKKKPKTSPAFKPIRKKVKTAGPVTFKLALSKEAAKTYKAKGKLRLTIRQTFTPTKGKKISKTRKITLIKPVVPKTPAEQLRDVCRKDKTLARTKQCKAALKKK